MLCMGQQLPEFATIRMNKGTLHISVSQILTHSSVCYHKMALLTIFQPHLLKLLFALLLHTVNMVLCFLIFGVPLV